MKSYNPEDHLSSRYKAALKALLKAELKADGSKEKEDLMIVMEEICREKKFQIIFQLTKEDFKEDFPIEKKATDPENKLEGWEKIYSALKEKEATDPKNKLEDKGWKGLHHALIFKFSPDRHRDKPPEIQGLHTKITQYINQANTALKDLDHTSKNHNSTKEEEASACLGIEVRYDKFIYGGRPQNKYWYIFTFKGKENFKSLEMKIAEFFCRIDMTPESSLEDIKVKIVSLKSDLSKYDNVKGNSSEVQRVKDTLKNQLNAAQYLVYLYEHETLTKHGRVEILKTAVEEFKSRKKPQKMNLGMEVRRIMDKDSSFWVKSFRKLLLREEGMEEVGYVSNVFKIIVNKLCANSKGNINIITDLLENITDLLEEFKHQKEDPITKEGLIKDICGVLEGRRRDKTISAKVLSKFIEDFKARPKLDDLKEFLADLAEKTNLKAALEAESYKHGSPERQSEEAAAKEWSLEDIDLGWPLKRFGQAIKIAAQEFNSDCRAVKIVPILSQYLDNIKDPKAKLKALLQLIRFEYIADKEILAEIVVSCKLESDVIAISQAILQQRSFVLSSYQHLEGGAQKSQINFLECYLSKLPDHKKPPKLKAMVKEWEDFFTNCEKLLKGEEKVTVGNMLSFYPAKYDKIFTKFKEDFRVKKSWEEVFVNEQYQAINLEHRFRVYSDHITSLESEEDKFCFLRDIIIGEAEGPMIDSVDDNFVIQLMIKANITSRYDSEIAQTLEQKGKRNRENFLQELKDTRANIASPATDIGTPSAVTPLSPREESQQYL